MIRLFLYGTLLDPPLLTRLTGRPQMMMPARLDGWRRVWLRDVPYPTIVRGRGRVHGAMILADFATLRRLRAYEGPRYRLMPVNVVYVRDRFRAHAWIGNAPTRRPWP